MTPAEVARAQAQMKAGMLMGLESPSSRAERLARMVQVWGRVPTLPEMVARVDAVTLADVTRFAEAMVAHAPMAQALYGPVRRAPVLAAMQERRAA
jgi:predicted Zn-dependent peptidase